MEWSAHLPPVGGGGVVSVVSEQEYTITYGLRRSDTMSNMVLEHKLV